MNRTYIDKTAPVGVPQISTTERSKSEHGFDAIARLRASADRLESLADELCGAQPKPAATKLPGTRTGTVAELLNALPGDRTIIDAVINESIDRIHRSLIG